MDFGNRANPNEVELNDYQPIEKGKYNAQIIEESEKTTANGGKMLVYKFRIFGEKYNGRTLFANFNVVCPSSEQAEEIAYKQIAKLGKACGLSSLVDSSQLINQCCAINVEQEPYEGKIRNKIAGFDYEIKGASTPTSAEAPAQAKTNWWEKK